MDFGRPNQLDDLTHDENVTKLGPAITKAVRESFDRDKCEKTRSEVKRRFDLCYEIAKQLRYDLAWGISRITDHLSLYLRAELNGSSWEPDKRQCWMPGDD